MKTVLRLPFPPSVNGLYDGGRNTSRRFMSDAYRRWQDEAGLVILTQPARHSRHTGLVQVTYSFTPPDDRRRDVFNYEKAVSDLLVKHGILTDDSLIHRGTVEWCDGAPGVAVLIEPLPAG